MLPWQRTGPELAGLVPPFLAGDIIEPFDSDRAAEAFEVLAGMAGVGQVIDLTHHRHLCDIARRVCPQVRLHPLGAAGGDVSRRTASCRN